LIEIVTAPQVANEVLAQWAIDRLHNDELASVSELGPYQAFGVLKDGRAVCVVIWNWFRTMKHGNDARVIIVSEEPSWCLPGVLAKLFHYPFEIAGCTRITAVIRDGNETSLKLCQGLGFKREGILRRAHNGKTNAVVLGMLQEECKWLNRLQREDKLNGKKVPFSSDAARSSENGSGAVRRKHGGTAGKRPHKRGEPVRASG